MLNTTVKMRQWQNDSEVTECPHCQATFSFLLRKHHCRLCGIVVCASCSKHKSPLPTHGYYNRVRICDKCVFKCISSEMEENDQSNELLASPLSNFETLSSGRRFGLNLTNLLLQQRRNKASVSTDVVTEKLSAISATDDTSLNGNYSKQFFEEFRKKSRGKLLYTTFKAAKSMPTLWLPDEYALHCFRCYRKFTILTNRRHQ